MPPHASALRATRLDCLTRSAPHRGSEKKAQRTHIPQLSQRPQLAVRAPHIVGDDAVAAVGSRSIA
jgi:hypothetical protein